MKYKPISSPRNLQLNLKPWQYVVISIIVVLVSFMIGITLATKVQLGKATTTDEEKENPRVTAIYNYLGEVKDAILNHDIGFLETRVKGNDFEMTKGDYKAIVGNLADNEILLNKFINTLGKQSESYLSGNPLEHTFFYIDDVDGKVGIKVNQATVRFIPRSRIDEYIVETEDGETHSRTVDENGGFNVSELLPIKTKLKVKSGDWSEEHDYNFIEEFCKNNSMSNNGTTIKTLAFRRGVGISVSVSTNVEEAKLYINGESTDIKISNNIEALDGLKEGDTLRAEYQGERSKEFKVRKNNNNSAQLDFEIAKEEERFGIPKSDVDSGEVIAKNLLNSVSNGVNAKDANVLSNLVESGIAIQAHNVVNDLINKYASLSFSHIQATSASKSGTRLDMKLSYSYETISSFGDETIQNGNMTITVDLSSAKVLGFSLN